MSTASNLTKAKFSGLILPALVVGVLAAAVCGATLIPASDCEACGGTGVSEGLKVSDYQGSHECEICGGTLRISIWSAWLGAHAEYMRPHRRSGSRGADFDLTGPSCSVRRF